VPDPQEYLYLAAILARFSDQGIIMSFSFNRLQLRLPIIVFCLLLSCGSLTPALLTPVTAAPVQQANSTEPALPTEQAAFFAQRIQPILANHCYECHSFDTRTAGQLSLDDRQSLLAGGKSGPAIVPGHPDESLLIHRVLDPDPDNRMPKKAPEPLSEAEIADLKTWIAQGAPWPAAKASSSLIPSATSSAGVSSPVAIAQVTQEVRVSGNIAKPIPYPRPATPAQLAYFEKNVRPILVNRCYNCHSDAFKEAGGLRVDVGIAIFTGGNDGPVIVPGHPEKSLLIQRIKSADAHKRMPQESNEPLPAEEIATLEAWVKDGAAWPDETEKLPQTPGRIAARYDQLRASHWAWQPLTSPPIPAVHDTAWSSANIDRFVLAKLDEKKLAPVKDADALTLIRRLTYDLTGLQPSPTDVKDFVKDHSPAAYARLVDRLLASPQYGERWGRHWLDVARYAESSGPSRNIPYPNAWRYRDYVIDAFNRDVPYNRFLQEQIAGDLLPAETPAERDRLLIATGYLALGPKDVNQRFKARFKMDNVDDQIDTVTRSTMALTVSCARCHDHKFDPIPTTDYYALASIFTSTVDAAGVGSRMGGASLQYYEPKLLNYLSDAGKAPKVPQDQVDMLKAQVDSAKKTLDDFDQKYEAELKANPGAPTMGDEHKKQRAVLARNWINLSEELKLTNDLGELGYGIHGARDGVITDTAVRIRGVEERHGPIVPRNYISLIKLADAPIIPPDHSGRLELAQWIINPAHPLTARVYVNRVWQHLFGTGIVSTVDNFGSMGDQPSNPELLDYLAQDFIRNGWSTKKLVREIVLSRAYRLGTDVPSGYRDIDPGDRLVWRHAPHRLEAEEIRDSILRSSRQLDLSHPAGSPSMRLRMIEMRDDGPVVHSILKAADRSPYRSIYLPQLRGEVPRPLAAFDPVSQTLVTGQREETTVPTQALFLLNSPFVREQSLNLASDLLSDKRASDTQRIRSAFERIIARDPNAPEIEKVKRFLLQYATTWRKSHSDGKASTQATLVSLKHDAQDRKPFALTEGIFRSDNLSQDDPDDTSKQFADETPVMVVPDSAHQAAWAAFVQSLFGSAEFQFVR
jgi:mono/diheme cytochrome c family protein